jgi:hypothetical protein
MKTAQRRCHCWPILLPILFCGNVFAGTAAAVEPARCPASDIAVPQWSAAERDRICAAAEAAIVFLRAAGFEYRDGLTIRPLQNPLPQYRGSEVGHFDIARNEIEIMTLEAAVNPPRLSDAFDVPVTPELWASYISHEVAHAVTERHFAAGVNRFTASEYIAAVVQLVTMEPALRAAILARFPDLEPYPSTHGISALYYLIAPGQFAVKVYLHYLELGDAGPEFLHWLVRNGLSR